MRFARSTIVIGAAAVVRHVSALLVAENSPCEIKCGNVLDATTSADVVCKPDDYGSVSAGIIFDQCVNCEATSPYTSGERLRRTSDLGSMLYNMRYATAYCLFGDPDNESLGSSPCITSTACGPLKTAIEIDSLSLNASTYSYCAFWDAPQVEKCTACLRASEDGHITANFIDVLDGACSEQPELGATLSIDGDIFSMEDVNVTGPAATATFVSDAHNGPLTHGAIAGIAIGGLCGVLILLGCCVVLNGKRKRKAYLRQREQLRKAWPSPLAGSGGEMFETPISQRPLRGWGDSPISAPATETSFPRYVSPYSSQYNSPVSAGGGPGAMVWPQEKLQNIGIALSPETEAEDRDAEQHWTDHKGKEKDLQREAYMRRDAYMETEGYELQEGINSGGYQQTGDYQQTHPQPHPSQYQQAPVLGHPGYGRNASPPQTANWQGQDDSIRPST